MKYIMCKFDMFNINQTFYLIEDNRQVIIGQIPIEEIIETLPVYCNRYEAYKIHFYGNSEYLYKISEEIMNTKYSNKPIEIEVN